MQKNERWTEELAIIANIISKLPLEKTIKWGADVFTFNGKNVVSYGGFKNFFGIWFYNGVFLKDKYKVLVSAQSKTKQLRQWRFTSKNEIDEKKITEYIKEAIEIEKKGLKIKAEKFTPVPIPELLEKELDKDKNPNIKRAVIEGLRIWTNRPYFKDNPTRAIQLISEHKSDDSEYLRKPVGNALRDIFKKHADKVLEEISTWDLTNNKTAFTYKLVIGK